MTVTVRKPHFLFLLKADKTDKRTFSLVFCTYFRDVIKAEQVNGGTKSYRQNSFDIDLCCFDIETRLQI